MTRRVLIAGVLLAALVSPTAASAQICPSPGCASVSITGTTPHAEYRHGNSVTDRVVVKRLNNTLYNDTPSPQVIRFESTAAPIEAGVKCDTNGGFNIAECEDPNPGSLGRTVFILGPGDDRVEAQQGTLQCCDLYVGLVFHGEDGHDTLLGSPLSDQAFGGSNEDSLSGFGGNDTLNGEGGADTIKGGDNADEITGGPGADSMEGEGGHDQLFADDGVKDTLVDCGAGTEDEARVDALDEPVNCEVLKYDADEDGSYTPEDCNDSDPEASPDKSEVPGNGRDENCDGVVADRDGDGVTEDAGDCDDNDPTRRPGLTEIPGNGKDDDCVGGDASPDNDRDGQTVAAGDCDDSNSTVRKGAVEIRGNDVDENCDGVKLPGFVQIPISNKWAAGATTTVLRLEVRRLPAGATVQVRCKSARKRTCPFSKKTARPKRGRVNLKPLFKKRRLRVGTVVEVRILVPGMIGKVVRYTIRRRALPSARQLCLEPGSSRPGSCPRN